MRRVTLVIVLLALALAGCGGTPADTTVALPTGATAVAETTGNAKVDAIVAEWKAQVPKVMKEQLVKDPIEEKVYHSDQSLQQIADFYKKLTETSWHESTRMPGLQSGLLLTGYENGNVTLVVGAIDEKPLGGAGVLVYTAKGSK